MIILILSIWSNVGDNGMYWNIEPMFSRLIDTLQTLSVDLEFDIYKMYSDINFLDA